MRRLVPITMSAITLLPALLRADALSDLRATLAQLPATAAVHGTFEVTSTVTNSDDPQITGGKASVGFEADSNGLRIVYSKSLLTQASQEARVEEADPDKPTPVRSGAERVHPLQLADLLDAAAALNTQLLNAQVTDVKALTFQGVAAHLLVLKLNPKLSKGQAKHMKKVEASMSLWLGPDGVPLAGERTFLGKASFMLLSFEFNQTANWTYTRSGDRLVMTRYEEKQKTDGLGEHESSRVEQTVRLER